MQSPHWKGKDLQSEVSRIRNNRSNFCFPWNLFIHRLRREPSITIRFLTNTTKESKDTLLGRLHRIGFTSIKKEELFSSLSAAAQYVQQHNLNPLYFLTDDARQDFVPTDERVDKNAVVIGLAPEKFTYENMNDAFR